jgi:hypothetical protein
MSTVSFLGEKWLVRGIDHPPPYSAEVKERVELYFYSTSGPLWPVTGQTLPYCCVLIKIEPCLTVFGLCREYGFCASNVYITEHENELMLKQSSVYHEVYSSPTCV